MTGHHGPNHQGPALPWTNKCGRGVPALQIVSSQNQDRWPHFMRCEHALYAATVSWTSGQSPETDWSCLSSCSCTRSRSS